METNQKNIEYGKSIRKRMITAGFKSQRELAAASKIPYGVLRRITCGSFAASREYKTRLNEALKCAAAKS